MKNFNFTSVLSHITKAVARWRDDRGVSAIEFALVFPVLLTIYMGVAELSQGLTLNRKVTQISSSVADLVSQEKTMGANEIGDIYLAAEQIIAPYNTSPLVIVVTSVEVDGNGNPSVGWSSSSPDGFSRSTGSSVALPNGLDEPNSGVIMTEVRYDYTSPLAKFITGTITLEDQFFLSPRNSSSVTWN